MFQPLPGYRATALNSMSSTSEDRIMETVRLTSLSRGGGCGCKIEPAALHDILAKVPKQSTDPRLLVGIENSDDAAIYQINEQQALVFTNDFFTATVDDPYIYGRIAAANSLSDIYAMGGDPILANAIVGFPVDKLSVDTMQEIMRGGVDVCADANVPLAGGHSIDNPQPIFGLAAVGIIRPDLVKTNSGTKAGDVLLLTKPLGIGILASAFKMDAISDEGYRKFIHYITMLNKAGSWLGKQAGIHAMTDITGFGLAGHLLEMAKGSRTRMLINAQAVPVIEEAWNHVEEGIVPSGAYRNMHSYGDSIRFDDEWNIDHQLIFTDPQTNGGLLVAVDPVYVDFVISNLKTLFDVDAAVIGKAIPNIGAEAPVVFQERSAVSITA
ncbi:MAG: selenide, water dikinase SelD [Gammaproteobacteria bacterium]|nr:selenide, water dikinase SelD [Gammaproteobacteria bacterium]